MRDGEFFHGIQKPFSQLHAGSNDLFCFFHFLFLFDHFDPRPVLSTVAQS